ncbi:hypothetical protein [Pseudomonas sp. PS02303]|uniref:hypothetical protein n=1 Tax=Pseudomonas sp. PS02303 TaxID=2991429 RepID=UPI00249CE70E|nr:hypothetical protein [Pseudomonas sp. PS02303]
MLGNSDAIGGQNEWKHVAKWSEISQLVPLEAWEHIFDARCSIALNSDVVTLPEALRIRSISKLRAKKNRLLRGGFLAASACD